MANPELSQRIQELPEELLGLEREPGIAERLRRIDALKDRARALDPLDGVEDMALADYDRDWLVRYTYNSNAIEGSTLTLEDTSLVLEGEFVPSDSPARYVFAARGVADGMAYVREYAREGRRLDEELVRRVHDVTMSVAAGDAPMFPDDVKERFARTDFILDMYESGVYNREEAGEKLFDHLFGKGRAVMDSEG